MIKYLSAVYHWVRGFLFGILNSEEADRISIQIEICDDCTDDELCDEHEKEMNEAVYGRQ